MVKGDTDTGSGGNEREPEHVHTEPVCVQMVVELPKILCAERPRTWSLHGLVVRALSGAVEYENTHECRFMHRCSARSEIAREKMYCIEKTKTKIQRPSASAADPRDRTQTGPRPDPDLTQTWAVEQCYILVVQFGYISGVVAPGNGQKIMTGHTDFVHRNREKKVPRGREMHRNRETSEMEA